MSFKSQLDAIEADLEKWRAGKKIHKFRASWCVGVLPGGMFLYGVWNQQAGFTLVGILLAFLLAQIMLGTAETPDSREGRINQALRACSPIDKNAFEKLCRTVNEKKAIEPDDVAEWLKDEKEALALFERKQDENERYSFTKWLDERESDQNTSCNEEGK
ncbi:hypothetical protein [Enterobacter soli]|uniref:hypothetical protein n=1 Tax=Enterobacter soli TaxID=885040 RepID=UPI003EDA828C